MLYEHLLQSSYPKPEQKFYEFWTHKGIGSAPVKMGPAGAAPVSEPLPCFGKDLAKPLGDLALEGITGSDRNPPEVVQIGEKGAHPLILLIFF